MPSLLFINRVYPPDIGATGRVLEHVARGFVAAGWQVTVLTTVAERSKAGSALQDGVKVVRIALPFSKKSLVSRALGYAVMIPVLGVRALSLPRADVVVTKTDPPMLVVLGPILYLLKGARTIHWAQDLYPEVAEELGAMRKGGMLAGVCRAISTWAMQRHDITVTVGRCMESRLKKRGIPASRILVIPNTGIEQEIQPLERDANPFRARHGLGNAFLVEYSGNLGRAHDFDTVLQAACLLQERGEEMLFLIIGGGPGEQTVRDEAGRLGLKNIRFLPPQPVESLSESLGAGDVHVVTMREGASGMVVPSKFYGVLAAARPCLFIGPADSEVALTIGEHDLGEVIAPGSVACLAKSILRYRNDLALCRESGLRGRAYLQCQDSLRLFLQGASELLLPGA
jgi:glycosyltransferase involved in cell wall biosynthesis